MADAVHDGKEPGEVKAKGAPWHDRWGFGLFLAMVVLCPIPDGSATFQWVYIWATVAAVAAVLLSYSRVTAQTLAVFGAVLAVMAAYCLVAWLQNMWPSPAPRQIWGEAGKLLDMDLHGIAAGVRDEPFRFLGRPLLSCLVFVAAVLVGGYSRRCKWVARSLVGAACLFGFFGVIEWVIGSSIVRDEDISSSLTVLFISKNTTATYLGSVALLGLALVVVPITADLGLGLSLRSAWSRRKSKSFTLLLAGTILLLLLLPLTASRAGVMLTLFVILGLAAAHMRNLVGYRVTAIVLLLSLFALVFAVSGELSAQRFANRGLNTLGRIEVYKAMLQYMPDHLLLGAGLGSFADVFPSIRPPAVGVIGFWNIGHSSPVELLFEGGLPLALVVLGMFIFIGVVLVRGLLRRPDDPYILAGLLVGILGVAHSSIDFSLQISGYTIIFMTVVGMGVGRALRPLHKRRRSEPEGQGVVETGPSVTLA